MATVDRTGHGGPTRRTAVELAAYAAYGPLVVTWLRTAPETREGGAGIRRGRLVLGVVLGTIVVVALASNDPGEPGALLVWLRWAPVLLLALLVLVAGAAGTRRDGPLDRLPPRGI